MSRDRLIVATPWPPWPLDNGTRIRTARLAQCLSRAFDLTLVTFDDGPEYDETRASREQLERLLPDARIELVTYDTPPVAPGGRLESATWGRFATPNLRAALGRLVRAHPGAILQLEHPGAGLAGLGLAPGRTVYSAHNIEHRIWREVTPKRPAAHRPYLEVEWRKIDLEERRCWRGADLCLAVSQADADTMLAGGARSVQVTPNGSDAHDPLAPARFTGADPLRLLFVGNGLYWPYEHGLSWFVGEVLPSVPERLAIAFDVVGARPADRALAPGVTYHGRVDSLRPFYEAAHALVIPVFEGSGTRLKLIEASFFGRPVISTTLGAEGLPLRAGEHYARADSVAEWVLAIEQLAIGQLAEMPERARAALRDFTWPQIGAALGNTYRRLARG